MLEHVLHFTIFFVSLQCHRITGNAEVRPANVTAALTAEAGGIHKMNPPAFLHSRQTQIHNIIRKLLAGTKHTPHYIK